MTAQTLDHATVKGEHHFAGGKYVVQVPLNEPLLMMSALRFGK